MSKIEIGVVITLIISVVSGALFLGQLDGRLSAIEDDKDYASLKEDKKDAIQLIELAKTQAMAEIEKSKGTLEEDVSSLKVNVGNLSSKIENVDNRKLCYCIEARHNGSSCSSNGGWTAYKGDGKTPDKIKVYYCE
ncbi:hypothetical protein ACPV48_25170 [Vibrio harveyi]|uniref:hypothetical protein n=1 Tax=Vibrio harveyi TaxID=669 RepID=UPI0040680293